MKHIIFDVDDTLYNLMEPFQKAHEELFSGKSKMDCEELFKASRIYSDEAFYMVRDGKLPKEDEFAYRIIKTYKGAGMDVGREEAKRFEERYRYYQNHIHVSKQMQEILTECRKKAAAIGLLTNGTAKNQGKKLRVLGLDRWFPEETMFISDAIGYTKPDPKAFLTVQESMKLNPEDTWFVGDTFEVDVIGAKRAGWHVIWFNHRRRPMPKGKIVPDMEVETAEALYEKIKEVIE